MMSAKDGVAVVGGGAWGLGLAAAAARTGKTTLLLSRRAQGSALPQGVTLAKDYREIGARARLILLAVPSSAARTAARELGDHIDGRHIVVHGVRGLVGDNDELKTIGDVLRDETPARRIGALGGPALVDDLLAGRPSVLVCGSHFPEVGAALSECLTHETLRLYTSHDRRGVEWASALVGCLAIGMGYAQGTGASPGLVAALLSRSVHEAARLAEAAGGEERTLLGLAGYGDLLAATGQDRRPEVLLGRALAKGATLADALAAVEHRIEAVDLVPRVVAWADRSGVRAPIFHMLADGVLSSRPTREILHEMMTGPLEAGS
ncbi:MAG: glycerol-3-phosphate dehydrogenase [Polyangiaceae bacterium]|jgi:glycerol-3-phosphate dehydrogenase (NAD(P)+)